MAGYLVATEFLELTPREQIEQCKLAAKEAKLLSAADKTELRWACADLARQWSILAHAIAREAALGNDIHDLAD